MRQGQQPLWLAPSNQATYNMPFIEEHKPINTDTEKSANNLTRLDSKFVLNFSPSEKLVNSAVVTKD